MSISAVTNNTASTTPVTGGSATKAGAGSTDTVGTGANATTASQDRFLKLLVAQLSNQDPMNPMDNAAMTTQMAQINTVNGIEKLNTTMTSMLSQLGSMQTLQGAALTGHDVLISGNSLTAKTGGGYSGSFSLPANAENVSVDVLTPGGQVLDHINLGAQGSGTNQFSWDNSSYTGSAAPTFRINATAGGQPVSSTSLMRGSVESVSASNGALQLNLKGMGTVPYANVVSVL